MISFGLTWLWKDGQAGKILPILTVLAILFTGSFAAWGVTAIDKHKSTKPLIEIVKKHREGEEIRIGTFDHFHPSLVFYSQQPVKQLFSVEDAVAFVEYPMPVYLLTPSTHLESVRKKSTTTIREIGRHYDFYKGKEVVLITNR